MDVLVTILQFLAVLAVVVMVHEFGHFATAKAFGIKVNEFGFGFPPRVIKLFHKGDTDYTINLLPIGGFVRLEGENDPTHPRSLASKGIGTRFIVLVAGVFMNVVLTIALFSGLFMFSTEELRVGQVAPGSPAEGAGVVAGDTILEVDGKSVTTFGQLSTKINDNLGTEIGWLIKRDGAKQLVHLMPREVHPEGEGATGITISSVGVQRSLPTRTPWESVYLGLDHTWFILTSIKDEVVTRIGDNQVPVDFVGPVGITQLTGEVVDEGGLISLVSLAALLSMFLAIFNILPIPALDGGRLMFVILEWVRRGKRISPQKEGLVHLVGFVVLIALILVPATYKDIVRLVEGNSFLP